MSDPETLSVKPQQQPALSLWLLAVILLIVGYAIYSAAVGGGSIRHNGAKQIKVSDGDLDDQSVQDLVSVDLEGKAAFISSLVDGKPDRKYLKEALNSGRSLVDDSHNAPFAARRLIILRVLYGVPVNLKTRGGNLPLDAYDANLPAAFSASDRATYLRESKAWQDAFTGPKPTPAQTAKIAAEIRTLPNLKWWRAPALYALYNRAGDTVNAKKQVESAANSCVVSIAIALVLMLFKLMTVLAGIVLLIVLAVALYQRRTKPAVDMQAAYAQPMPAPALSVYGQPGTPAIAGMQPRPSEEIWKVEPEPIAPDARRLTAADLFSVFLFYMVFSSVFGLIVAGFPGFGHHHTLKFAGLITPFLHRISTMPSSTRMVIVVGLETFMYVVTGGLPILWLVYLARKRGASLGKEIGLTRRVTFKSILYGVGGYCLGMPLMLAVALIAPKVFRHFPSPSNPAIPQLISANSLPAAFLLIGLASIAAPIIEETLFRGVLYNAIKMRTGVWPAILLSGFIFGFIHPVGIAEMFPLAVLGGVFAWMAETRKSLMPSMVAHCLNNLSSCLLVFSLMQQ